MDRTRKILAMMVTITMVSAGLIIVSPNSTVIAEDSAMPLAALDTGFPATVENLDQMDDNTVAQFTVADTQQGAQKVMCGMDGDLTKIEISVNTFDGAGNLYYQIQDGSAGLPGTPMSPVYSVVIGSLLGGMQWNELPLDTSIPLSNGQWFAIVLWTDAGSWVYVIHDNTGTYGGTGFQSGDSGASFTPLGGGGQDFCFKTYMDVPSGGLTKIAWHSDGSYALGVTGFNDEIYKYTRQTGTWASEYNLDSGYTFNDIKYSSNFNLFYIVGTGAVPLGFSYYEPTGSLANLNAPIVGGAYFNGLCLADENGATDFAFLAVGYNSNTNDPYAAWYNQSSHVWTDVNSGWSGADEILYDVTWDHGATGNPYYAVGKDYGTGMGVVYYFTTTGDNTANLLELNGWLPGPLFAIDWQPAGTADHAVIVGALYSYGNVWSFNGSFGEAILNNSYILNDVCFHPDGSMAMIVGETNSFDEGVIYHYTPDNNNALAKMSTDGDLDSLYGVDVKAWTSPSSGLIVGASGAIGSFLSATDTGTTITVNSAFPHSFDIDMWKTSDAGRTSKLNTQVNVETTYTFMTEVNYTIDGVDQFYGDVEDDIAIILTAWYDDGNTPSADPDDNDDNRTRNFQAIWQEGLNPGEDTGGMIYPGGAIEEVQYVSSGIEAGPGDHYYVYINLTFGPQLWAADGQGFLIGGASSNINDGTASFNDPDSWDFVMGIVDLNFQDAVNLSFEEFGIFRFTNITASGSPSGNAAPGQTNVPLGNSQLQVSSNIPYYVNVSIPRLNKTTDNTKFIPASSINISLTSSFANNTNTQMNGSWGANGRAFPGTDQQLGIWGNASLA
ncbi:MAG: hypothetical protein KAS16_06070, partial [Thermoplasmata archaeon]|nr:hypothetical protein [Thermoplasmata archaeon]